jgi:glycosyltransferase involved in cell wall biosynthesis
MPSNVKYAALYDLRLAISRKHPVVHIEEYLYTSEDSEKLSTEQKQFAYVDPKNRSVQIEMEEVCTNHLKKINAWFPPVFEETDLESGDFEMTASVIIPVRNRAKTISDAIESVLNQKTRFSFNCIIIDNHSTDGTTEIIKNKAAEDARIVHIIPERNDLGIGGCWNLGIHDNRCGRFAIQLDSDDVYSGDDTIEKIVAGFYEQKCAMLVGSYRMCNFNLETIPPGIIDHKEWTLENGRNNALRINGLGAPRAFSTGILRTINIPNVSYGEDYALGLQFSRRWKIGRIFDVLYLCRRWEDNSDASIDIVKLNKYNHFKDKLRSIEITARQNINTIKQ